MMQIVTRGPPRQLLKTAHEIDKPTSSSPFLFRRFSLLELRDSLVEIIDPGIKPALLGECSKLADQIQDPRQRLQECGNPCPHVTS